jgi:hypothetical protein
MHNIVFSSASICVHLRQKNVVVYRRSEGTAVTEAPARADAELHLTYRLLGSVLRPLARKLRQVPPGGLLAVTTDDP